MGRYSFIQKRCLTNEQKYRDVAFPATSGSLYHSKKDSRFVWKRPNELSENATFEHSVQLKSLDAGAFGSQRLVAVLGLLANRPALLKSVAPVDQHLQQDYAGVFHMVFWRAGRRQEIIIDDRLPVWKDEDTLGGCRDGSDSFLVPLVEKAYAKFHGTYEKMSAASEGTGLADFVNGVVEILDLSIPGIKPPGIFSKIRRLLKCNCIISAALKTLDGADEIDLSKAFTPGLSCEVTNIKEGIHKDEILKVVCIRRLVGKNFVRWKKVSEEEAKSLDIEFVKGQQWVMYDDWISHVVGIEFCYLTEAIANEDCDTWHEFRYSSSVGDRKSGATRSISMTEMYWNSPQLCFTIDKSHLINGECLVAFSLLQQQLSKQAGPFLPMAYDLLLIHSGSDNQRSSLTEEEFGQKARKIARRSSMQYSPYGINQSFFLYPGTYVVVVSALSPVGQSAYSLRILTQTDMDVRKFDAMNGVNEVDVAQELQMQFNQLNAAHDVIDMNQLRDLLSMAYSKFLNTQVNFDNEVSRNLLRLCDSDCSGVLECDDLMCLWKVLQKWRTIFDKYGASKNGPLDYENIGVLFTTAGLKLDDDTLQVIIHRYCDRNGSLCFTSLVSAYSKLIINGKDSQSLARAGSIQLLEEICTRLSRI